MREYIAFVKKEILEQLRTYKMLILISVFFLLGMMSPLIAKIMPDILSGMKIEGMTIQIPDPTKIDAYSQFFKNFNQMGLLVLLLVFGGILSNELIKGTLVNVLAKGLSRATVILSKFTSAVILWTVGYVIAVLTTYGYTYYLFGNATEPNLIFSLFCLWMFGCFLISIILLSGTLTSGTFGGLIVTAVILVILLMISIVPNAWKYNPMTLASKNLDLLKETVKVSEFYPVLIITAVLTIASLYIAISLFRRKKM